VKGEDMAQEVQRLGAALRRLWVANIHPQQALALRNPLLDRADVIGLDRQVAAVNARTMDGIILALNSRRGERLTLGECCNER
jgi:hypothetical protein